MKTTTLVLAASFVLSAPALAKGKPAPAAAPAKKIAPPTVSQARAMTQMMGKFKWGMSTDDVFKVLDADLTKKYDELLAKEPDVYKQDQLRKQKAEEVEKLHASVINFDGKKSGWDVSIIDKEFGHRNDESMLVLWEPNQRRFLFFWRGKLYKQYIAFNAEHPAFAGKSFDDFGKILQDRYGQAELKFAALKTKDDMTLDHMEWPPQGDTTLWAVDQSGFYGNFCVVLRQTATAKELEKARPAGSRPGVQQKGSALIDTVTKPPTNNTDPNADIIDEITGRKPDGKTPEQK